MASSGSARGGKSNKKSQANCPEIQLVVRDNKGWRLYKQHAKSGKLQAQSSTKPCTDADIVFSADGQYFAVLLEEGIEIYECERGRKLCFLPHYRVRNVYFSPKNTFIVSYHHRRQSDKHGNCWVWKWDPSATDAGNENDTQNDEASNEQEETAADDEEDGNEQKSNHSGGGGKKSGNRVIYNFFLPEFNKKHVPLQFSNDEFMAARITRNAVLIHDVKRLHYKSNNIIGKLDIANVATVVVAPCPNRKRRGGGGGGGGGGPGTPSNDDNAAQNSYLLAVFAMPKNTKAATVTIYEYQYNMAMNKKSNTNKLFFKISQRAFYGVDQCELLWDSTNAYHHNLLAIASSDVDTSGKSYYGHQTLFLLSSRNNMTVKIPISEKGKLQDVAWHPNGKEFVMIDDHPQKITVLDFRGNTVKSLGHYARNLVRLSKDGRFLWCGGFGNLTGEMTFYDYKNIKNDKLAVLGYNTDDACRYFAWSPDCSSFVTARLYPYMTVDNGFRIYKYNGQRLYEESFDRLYQITFRPSAKGVYPPRSVSPSARGKAKAIPKPQQKKRYVPPHLRSAQTSSSASSSAQQPKQQPSRQQQQQQQQQQQRQRQAQQQQQQQQRQQQQQQQQHAAAQRAPYQQQQSAQQGYNQNQASHAYQGFVPHQQQQQQHQHQQYQGQPPPHAAASHQGSAAQQYGQPPSMQSQQAQYGGVYYHHEMEHHQPAQPQQVNGSANAANMNGAGDANDNDASNENKKRKRRKRKSNNANKGAGAGGGGGAGTGGNNAANNGQNGRFKPGLADNDNKRWARGSKYTE